MLFKGYNEAGVLNPLTPLTGMIDVATRVVPAAVLRPSTRSVDASVLLARSLTPEPFRGARFRAAFLTTETQRTQR